MRRNERLFRVLDAEQGSMALALLAVIVSSGLMVTMVANVIAGQRAVRFDRDHVGVIQFADAGVQDALYRMGNPAAPQLPPFTGTVSTGTGTNATYEVVASPNVLDAWEIRSTATVNGTQRRVTALVERRRLFQTAAFADTHLRLRGGNFVRSYDATTWTGQEGVLGSNGTIVMDGGAGWVDGAQLYDYTAPNNIATRCTGTGNSYCSTLPPVPERFDITSDAALGFIDDVLTSPACAGATEYTGASLVAREEPYCFTRLTVPVNFEVTGPADQVAKVYLTGVEPLAGQTPLPTVSIPNKAVVNCTGCTGFNGSVKPVAKRLQIFTRSINPIRIGNHSHVAASIFAPKATCGGNYSNAGANFYGSLICSTITNQGAWSFHFDESLKDVGVGGWRVTRWSER